MIIAYVSSVDKECYSEIQHEFTDVKNFAHIDDFVNFYAANKNRDVVLLYRIDSLEDIEALNDVQFSNNIYMIVIGEDKVEYSLAAGKLGVDVYLDITKLTPQDIIGYINASQTVIKKRKGTSKVSVIAGINGGVGTTTIAMNLAKTLSDMHLDKNVLLLDFADTKAISNLFFDIIQPSKTIIDIATVQSMELDDFFANGLHKLSDNFYFVPGLQKHTDKEEFARPENIQVYLNFIMTIKEHFDFILIDVGVFKDEDLEVDIQELADDIYVLTEFNIPSMSILKTYIDIIDKSGWYSKTHIIANRADTFGSVTYDEAKKILSKGLKHNFEVSHSLPNDAMHLRECWNEAKLVSDIYPDAPFMNGIKEMIEKFFIAKTLEQENAELPKKKKEGILAKVKKWL